MITHFAELELHTLALRVVRIVYHERLGLPIVAESEEALAFELTPHTVLRFVLRQEPITPVHFAFHVPRSGFDGAVAAIKNAGLVITEIVDGDSPSLYFSDGEGHRLEIIALGYVPEDVLAPSHLLGTMYLREVMFPVSRVHDFRLWLRNTLDMKSQSDDEGDLFDMVVGGTAQAVVSDLRRRILGTGGLNVHPNMHVTFGTTDRDFMRKVRDRLAAAGELVAEQLDEIKFQRAGFSLALRHTPKFSADLPMRLKLPLSLKAASGDDKRQMNSGSV